MLSVNASCQPKDNYPFQWQRQSPDHEHLAVETMLSGGESRSGKFPKTQARVVELVVTAHSKCAAERRVGSNPALGTSIRGHSSAVEQSAFNR